MARSPSAWDADARSRGAGHDEMQEAVYDWFSDQMDEFLPIYHEGRRFIPGEVVIEYPLRRGEGKDDGDIEAFADIAILYAWEHGGWLGEKIGRSSVLDRRDFFYFFYELKPEIRSVGGLIRQCVALEHVAKRCGYLSSVVALVHSDDPKLEMLEKFSPYPVCAIGRDIMKAMEDRP